MHTPIDGEPVPGPAGPPDTEYLTRDLEHALESATRALVDHLATTMRCSRRQAVPLAVERIRDLTSPRRPA